MKILLDTHTFIWWDSSPEKLSDAVLKACQDKENLILFSMVSIWEMQIKHQLGKLSLSMPLRELINEQQQKNALNILPIAAKHIFELEMLPDHHKDPFDRLLIAQASIEGAFLASCDPIFRLYPVNLIW